MIQAFKRAVIAFLLCVSMCAQGTMVLAGTTGSISGTLTDANKAPVAGAKVTATSPSQTASVTTDASGRYSFFSLAPDTYALSAEKQGLEPVSITGINVFADGQQTVNLTSQAALRTIGRTTARSRADLVQSGRTTDAYTVTAATQQAASALGGGGSLNQAYSALASVPGVYIPQGQSGIYQSVYIRGGNYTELGYEFDGVPIQRSFDQYPSTALSALGQQNLQVYAGSAPLDAQSSGLAGFINQVIKTGTSPGFVNFSGSLGSPTYYKQSEFEAGGATKNGRFSYYVATAGYNQEYRYVDNFNGASLNKTFGTPYNLIAQNCAGAAATVGCYTNGAGFFGAFGTGPAGYANGPFNFGFQSGIADRETVANFHIGFPHKDGTKDDIQLLYDNSYLKTDFQTGLNDWGPVVPNIINGTAVYNGVTYPTCGDNGYVGTPCAALGGDLPTYVNTSIYRGPVGVALTPANVNNTQNYAYPYSNQAQNPTGAIPPAQRDTYDNRSAIEKVQFTKSLGSNAFARIYGYSFYSDWMQNGANSTVTNFAGGVSPDYELLAHTRGVALTVSDQVNRQNLLTLNGGYDYASTVRWNNTFYASSPTVAYAVSSANPAAGVCYAVTGAVGAPQLCNGAASHYSLNGYGTPGLSAVNGPTVNTIGAATCGGAPCEYLTVNNGVSGTYNTVAPAFTNLSFEDRIKPTDKLLLSLGVHYDDFRFNLTDTSTPAGPQTNTVSQLQRQFWTNVFINGNCQDPQTLLLATKTTPLGTACQAGTVPVTFSYLSAPVNDYHAFEPRFSATYTVDPLTVLRGSYSKIAQAPSSAYQQYNSAAGALPSVAQFYPAGFRNPGHNVGPEFSFNTDFSIEHSFKGTDAAFSLTPFYRSTAGEIFNVVLDPKTNFISGINVGKSYLEGAEFAIHKGDFGRDGFAAQLSYTYTYGRTHYDTLPNGQTVLQPINSGIQAYNGFTSFCAKNPKDTRCIQSGTNPTGEIAAPCYSATGDGTAAACGPGAIANPYWNSPVQSLFSDTAFYSPFNQTFTGTPGVSNNGVVSSYVVPHVAALLLQYKHGPLTVTPTFQLSAGGKYGSPTTSFGIDPSSCTGALGAAGVPGDNRYPNGLPAGATAGNEYLAQTCAGSVFTPNRYTGQFDNFGQYTEPATFTGNVAITYQLTKKVSFRATLVNVFDQCFGGTATPWNNEGPKIGCWYSSGSYAGNFYNPGNTFQSASQQYPYAPVFGNVFQSAYGAATNPFQAYFSLNINL